MPVISLELENEAATVALGRRLAPALRAGDVVRLSGELGAGKSTLARGAIMALAGVEQAPSPTFTFVESYETPSFPLWHFDLYRLENASEVWELGLEDALDGGVVLIEWPERIEGFLSHTALTIRLETSGGARRAVFEGEETWLERLKKRESRKSRMMTDQQQNAQEARRGFLRDAGWADADASPLAGDASTRCYERLVQNGRPAVLMIAPPGAETPDCPQDASPEERKALGYNAMARLAGPNLNAFLNVAKLLRDAGLSAPEIYAADAKTGFALIEDLGDDLFARVVGDHDEVTLYRAAIDALAHLHEANISPPIGAQYAMLDYDATAMEAEALLLLEWYWPLKKNADAPAEIAAEYQALWNGALASLSAPHVPVLRDYHAENLLWLPQRKGTANVGVIDFQDALFGHAAYDIVSLLEDARRDVSADLADAMLAHYISHARNSFDKDGFERDFAVLAAQRNAKILGIFARLAKRDGKPRYLELLPRVEAHFRNDMVRPDMAPIAAFISKHFPELAL